MNIQEKDVGGDEKQLIKFAWSLLYIAIYYIHIHYQCHTPESKEQMCSGIYSPIKVIPGA